MYGGRPERGPDPRAYLVRIVTRKALDQLRTVARRREEYDELAEAVGKSPAAVPQIAHRARVHVAERRPRGVISRSDTRGALEAFQRALATGDLQGLVDLLAPDVVALGDGGGVRQALPRPVVGAEKVARLLTAGVATLAGAMTAEPAQVNGWPALVIRLDGEIDSVVSLHVEDGLVSGIYTVRNSEKLSRIMREVAVSR